MRKLFILLLISAVFTKKVDAQANQTLSNLSAPTAVNTDLIPATDNSINLGSSTFRWKRIYTSDDALINGLTIGRGGGNNITNTAAGGYALYANTSGVGNTAAGYASLYYNQTGNSNSASGYASMYNNISGLGNTASGYFSLYANTTGYSNTAMGIKALFKTTTQYNLVAVGDSALFNNGTGTTSSTEAIYNTAIGSKALFSNTSGNVNTASGNKALYNNTSGGGNTANGAGALYYNSTGSFNTGSGYNAVYFTTTGSFNTGSGFGSLFSNSTGSNNTAMGFGTDVNSGGYSNTTIIGSNATGTASNQVRIGNSGVTSIGGYVNWTNVSDGRVKKNIKPNVPGLAFINKLVPVTYNLDLDAADKITERPVIKDRDGKIMQPSAEDVSCRKAKEAILYSGFVAQDVEKAAKSLNYNFSGVDAAKSSKDLYGLRYAEFVVPLVKAVQELSAANDEKDTKIESLEQRIAKLELLMNQQQSENKIAISLSSASLEQNIPNPFTNTTTINYTLPQSRQGGTTAQMVITDKTGKTIKSIHISGTGKGSLQVDASTLASGAYTYSLYIDGKLIDTKQMELLK